MPIMDGREFRRQQQAAPHLTAIPVILLSANAEAAKATASPDAVAYFTKPVDLIPLIETIQHLIAEPHG